MTLTKELQQLKDFQSDERSVLSIYLNTNPADPEQQNGAWKIHLKNGFKRIEQYLAASEDTKELAAFKELKEKVEKEIENHQDDLHKGIVIFASQEPKLWSVHYVQVPVKTSFHWENHPVVEELSYMHKAYPEAGVVLPSFGEVRILDTAMGVVKDELTYTFDSGLEVWREQKGMNPYENRGTAGSHVDDLDHRLRENLHRFYKEMGSTVEQLKKKRDWEEIHIAGEADLANSFASILNVEPASCIHKNLNNSDPGQIIHQVFEQ